MQFISWTYVLVFISVKFHLTRFKSIQICLCPTSFFFCCFFFWRNLYVLCQFGCWGMSWPQELTIWLVLWEAFPTVNEAWKLGVLCNPCGANRVIVISPVIVHIEITAVRKALPHTFAARMACFLAPSLVPLTVQSSVARGQELSDCGDCFPSLSCIYTTSWGFLFFCFVGDTKVSVSLSVITWRWIQKFQNNRK